MSSGARRILDSDLPDSSPPKHAFTDPDVGPDRCVGCGRLVESGHSHRFLSWAEAITYPFTRRYYAPRGGYVPAFVSVHDGCVKA